MSRQHHHRRRRFMGVRRRLWLKVWVALLLTLVASIAFMWTGGRVIDSFGGSEPDRDAAIGRGPFAAAHRDSAAARQHPAAGHQRVVV